MRIVRYRGRRGPEEHAIYEPGDEMPELGGHWRTAPEGSWVQADDGCVVQILKVGCLRDGARFIRTCTGTFRCLKDERLDTEPRQNRYTFNGKSPNYSKVTPAVDRFARLTARGMPVIQAYQAAFPTASDGHAKTRGRWLLNKREVREIVAQELGELMESMGIDERFILEQFMELAVDVDNPNARISALKELASMKGMLKKQTTSFSAKFQGFSQDRIEAAAKAVEMSGQALKLPAPTDDPDEIKAAIMGVPRPSEIDLETLEASVEVTMEDGGVEEDA